ncbi:MAG: hypothetical protein A3C85_02115 [Candidatus Doudnabacteria bacterium RIFCSPHIGHO2_02_FULL_48_21]|nr:MAG: hypothetical protein A3K05_02405 [Candidatus Doudnabacteria bacterium RIFCSPHIGHO2_01_48_18]OGE78431.1 MAG: hypothetical protein A2668_04410 [Candidatus Doudnabacteria bacterium RIFCSPHIGHO2_01_FULL_48_180]OGE91685.1 MAG: hypothetical protein A3F44_01440 [Candidatus Doudnabacteria bacterium RIFCSPHIGHO2_12_FULL_47_25]OGE93422.1 MAG: hypothetical protein A3C85_02115 [Candidatus Doudnabacteria bacterium RIFCSPHIGHO2_02_FULL_48_21]OGF02148.1 MAG: hypothetical protein A3G07_00845 [Candidatu
MSQKNIILIIVVVVIIGGISYFALVKKPQPIVQVQQSPNQNTPTPTPENKIAAWKTYKNQQFGFEFKYPETYEVVVETNRSLGHGLFFVGLRPKSWTDTEQFKSYDESATLLGIWVDVMSFNEAATQAGFEKQNGNWVLLGRQGILGEAKEITVQKWKGLSGITSVGSFQKGGGYAGLEDSGRAIINRDNDLSAFFEMTPLISEEVFNNLISTFKFLN